MRFFTAILACFLISPSLSWGREDIAFVLQGAGGKSLVRIITAKQACPSVRFDGRKTAVRVRAAPSANSPTLVCEASVPNGVKKISAGKIRLPVPADEFRRIVLIGDTGCRQKGNAFQDCERNWPFERISRAAAAFKPDLVIHVGDYLYREAPCPKCAHDIHGYGFDSWDADFFSPAKTLLEAAPWVVARGNHESCKRAGKGWFRFLDPESFSGSCRDYSTPYSVPISKSMQLIVFDSSSPDFAEKHYPAEFETVDRLAAQTSHSFFISHHPLLGFSEWHAKLFPGNAILQNALHQASAGRLFPPGIDAAFHGHAHLFEALNFENGDPATFVSGNSGTSLDEALPEKLPDGAAPYPGSTVGNYFSYDKFGFMTLEKKKKGWLVTERNEEGKPIWRCLLSGKQCLRP